MYLLSPAQLREASTHALDESETNCGHGLGDAEDVSPGVDATCARTALTNASLARVNGVSSTVCLASNGVERV